MKISWRMIGIGVVAYLLFLLITLPANVVASRLQSRGIIATGTSGSIWNGNAAALQIGRLSLGSVEWRVNVWRLFTGKLDVDARVRRDDGSLQGSISVGLGKKVVVRRLEGALPIAALGGVGLLGGWAGGMQLNLAEVVLENNWPVTIRGTVGATNLTGPAYQPTQIGSFQVEFDGGQDGQALSGKLSSTADGPFDVTGTLRLEPNRNYTIDAQVATRSSAPEQIAKALQYLGPPDAQGRRPLSMSGTL